MIAEIISIGTELLLGQITDTNRPYIAQKLSQFGIDSYHQSIVGDNYERMLAEITVANHRSDLVIMIGGLGPTEDDLTKSVAADFLQQPLVDDADALNKVVDWHQTTGVPMAESNKLQAKYINGGQAIKNDVGFAVGSYYKNPDGADFLLLPGPPWELEPMVDKYVLPLFQANYLQNQVMRSLVLRYYGIGESRLETELRPLIDAQTNPTIATYAKKHEVTVRLTAQAETESEADALNEALATKINEVGGEYLYGYDDDNSLAAVTNQAIQDHDFTVSVADNFTGGRVFATLNPLASEAGTYQAATLPQTPVTDTKTATVLNETVAAEQASDIVLSITPDADNSELAIDDTAYHTEKVWFSITLAGHTQTFERTLARDHASNTESAQFIALDTLRRTALNLPLLERK